jgi:serine/threonine-protein kinase
MPEDPQKIGRYAILRTLGGGGMGVVYLAEDPILKRKLAIKIVRGAQQEHMLTRFQREVEISAKLIHPNVVTVLDAGEEPGVGPFLAMEYVDGEGLDRLAQRGALNVVQRLRVLIHTAAALEAAHDVGIIHRDVKPANVMVARNGLAKLTDFGIARSRDTETLTETGVFVGTYAYTAPEIVRGAEASPATDAYALTVMAMELFTGVRPHQGATTQALLYNIAHAPPTMPARLDERWRAVFERALAKEPEARHPSMAHFLEALICSAPLDQATRADLLRALPPRPPEVAPPPTLQPVPSPSPVGPPPPRPSDPAPATEAAPAPPPAVPIAKRGVSPLLVAAIAVAAAVVVVGAAALFFLRQPQPLPGMSVAAVSPPVEPAAAAPVQAPPALPPAVVAAPTAVPAEPSREEITARARLRLGSEGFDDLTVVVGAGGVVAVGGVVGVGERERVAAALREVAGVTDVDVGGVREERNAKEIEALVVTALRAESLGHVRVEVDGDRHVVLSDLASKQEEAHARRIVDGLGEDGLEIRTALRAAPKAPVRRQQAAQVAPAAPRPAPAAPVWGEIQHEGSRRTD